MWELKRNKYIRYGFHLIERIRIKYSKIIIYLSDDNNIYSSTNELSNSHLVTYRLCNETDLDKIPSNTKRDRFRKTKFLKELKKGDKMVGAFLNSNIIGWNWISYEKVYVDEIDKWIDLNYVYVWNAYVMHKHRKKGIGMNLLELTLKIAKESSKNKTLFAWTETYNTTSQKMLESKGFKKQGIIIYHRFGNFKRWSVKILEESNKNRTLFKKILQNHVLI